MHSSIHLMDDTFADDEDDGQNEIFFLFKQ
jgi:hypothetical protein